MLDYWKAAILLPALEVLGFFVQKLAMCGCSAPAFDRIITGNTAFWLGTQLTETWEGRMRNSSFRFCV